MVCGLGAQSLNGLVRGWVVEACPRGRRSIAKPPTLRRVATERALGTAARHSKAGQDALFRDDAVRFRDLDAAN